MYEAIRPLINSMPEASTPDLLQLQKLTKTLKDNHELAKNGQQKTNANPENMTSLSQLQLQTPKDLFALIANPHEMAQLSDPTKQDKKAD